MTPKEIKGGNFSLKRYEGDGIIVTFFDIKGQRFPNGEWGMALRAGEGMKKPTPNNDVMDRVQTCIDEDIRAGKSEQIALILLDPRRAVELCLAGHITPELLMKAKEGKGFIDIPDIKVSRGRWKRPRNLIVRVMQDPENSVATADDKGNIL